MKSTTTKSTRLMTTTSGLTGLWTEDEIYVDAAAVAATAAATPVAPAAATPVSGLRHI